MKILRFAWFLKPLNDILNIFFISVLLKILLQFICGFVEMQEICVQFSIMFVFKYYTKLDRLKFVNKVILLCGSPVWFLTTKYKIIYIFPNHERIVSNVAKFNAWDINSTHKCIQQKCLCNHEWMDKIQALKKIQPIENIQPPKCI